MKPPSIQCMRCFLTVINVLCILFSFIISLTSVFILRDSKGKPQDKTSLSRGVLSFQLTLDLALIVTSALGCVGALREHVKILYVHACFFIFLVSVEVVVGVGGVLLSTWVRGSNELHAQFYKNFTVEDVVTNHSALWDNLQSEYQCCGVDGPQDYAILHREIPFSCCPDAHPLRRRGGERHLHANCITERSYNVFGCEEVIRQSMVIRGNLYVLAAIIFILVEVGCIITALWLASCIRAERHKLRVTLQAHFET